jgi:putative SOS response-associated peptidase YedK
MCGRITLHDIDYVSTYIQKHFQLDIDNLSLKKRYNITPKSDVLTILYDGLKFRAGLITWGMMIQSKDKEFFNINAKRESLKTYPYFKSLYQKKRMVMIFNGYFEWQDQGEYKTPYYIYDPQESVLCVAALYDKVDDSFGVTLMTEEASDDIKNIHNRMPVILNKEEAILYLKEGKLPNTKKELSYHQVSHEVNLKSSDHNKLIEPYDAFSVES